MQCGKVKVEVGGYTTVAAASQAYLAIKAVEAAVAAAAKRTDTKRGAGRGGRGGGKGTAGAGRGEGLPAGRAAGAPSAPAEAPGRSALREFSPPQCTTPYTLRQQMPVLRQGDLPEPVVDPLLVRVVAARTRTASGTLGVATAIHSASIPLRQIVAATTTCVTATSRADVAAAVFAVGAEALYRFLASPWQRRQAVPPVFFHFSAPGSRRPAARPPPHCFQQRPGRRCVEGVGVHLHFLG